MTRTNKILIAFAAIGLAACAFYFLALGPKRKEITRLDGEIAAKQAEIAQAEQMLATYENARSTYKRNYATLARLGKAVPADDDTRSLLVQLQSTAEQSGVDFQQIELGSGLAGGATADSGSTAGGAQTTTSGELAPAPGTVPVAGGALSAMPFNFKFTGGFFDLSTFFSRLERYVSVSNQQIDATGRLLRIESVSISPSSGGYPAMQAAIGAAAYIVPPLQGVATPGAAAPDTAENASAPSTPASPGTTTTATAGAAQ